MSVRVQHSVEIARPTAACWRLFTQVERWPDWFPLLVAARRGEVDEFRPGERLSLRLGFRGRGVDVEVRVEEAESGRRVRWIGRSLGVVGDHRFSIEPLEGPEAGARCRFSSEELFSGLPVRLVPKRLFAELEAETRLGLERFRALAESELDPKG